MTELSACRGKDIRKKKTSVFVRHFVEILLSTTRHDMGRAQRSWRGKIFKSRTTAAG